MKSHAPAPGVAHRAVEGELRLIDVRDADGQLLRKGTQAQVEELVRSGCANPIIGPRGLKEVRLHQVAPKRSAASKTLLGYTAASKANPRVTFHHDERACENWHIPGSNTAD